MPVSTNAPFNEFGQSMILRDIEQLYLALNGAGAGSPGDGQTQDQTAVTSQDSGGLPDLSSLATIDYVNQVAQDVLNSIPPTTLGGDLSGTTTAATVIKLQGNSLRAVSPSADEQALLWNTGSAWWEPVTLISNNGGLLTKDSGGLIEIAGGTALSVVGNDTNTAGSINAIAAANADTVLGRRGTSLTWAKVARSEQADGSACSVVGRSANSTGAVADISASSDGQYLQRSGGALSFAAITGTLPAAPSGAGWVLSHDGSSASWDQTVALGNTSAAGSLTIANSTSASAIVLATTLIDAAGKVMSVREIDVCDGGTAKKMLILASAPY